MKQTYVRSVKAQLAAIVTLVAFTFAIMLPTNAVAQAPAKKSGSSVLVTGQVATGGVFNGILKVTNVAVNSATGALSAAGTLSGTVTDATGQVVGTVSNLAVSNIPLASVTGSCTILTLNLGPLDLNLLGLTVHLNQVVLNITAVPGAGNLLGNLLCAVANLLNGGNLSNLLTQLTGLLNQILAGL